MRVSLLTGVFLTLALLNLISCGPCEAQLFGERTLGGSLSRRPSGGAAGTLSGDRRFLRGARAADDFVGAAADTGELVGVNAVAAPVTSSVAGLREETRPVLNRPRVVRPGGIYPERLTLDPGLRRATGPARQSPQLSAAAVSFMESRGLSVEVSREGHAATLRGEVPSAHDRQLTELLVKLEPGIRSVVNELTVNPALPRRERPRAPRDSH